MPYKILDNPFMHFIAQNGVASYTNTRMLSRHANSDRFYRPQPNPESRFNFEVGLSEAL